MNHIFLDHSTPDFQPSMFRDDNGMLSSRLNIFFINCPWPVRVSYSGGGDSGQIDEACFVLEGEPVPRGDQLDLLGSLRDLFEDMANVAMDSEHGGWENNEGGSGTFTVNPDGSCELNHSDNSDEYESSTRPDRWYLAEKPEQKEKSDLEEENPEGNSLSEITDEVRTALRAVFGKNGQENDSPFLQVRVNFSLDAGFFELWFYWTRSVRNPPAARMEEAPLQLEEKPLEADALEKLLQAQVEDLLNRRLTAGWFPEYDEDMLHGDLLFTADGTLIWNLEAGSRTTLDSSELFHWKSETHAV